MLDRWREARGDARQPDIRDSQQMSTAFEPGEVCIAMLAAELSDSTIEKLVETRTLWIRYEYLTAEPWSDAHHCLPSPHPRFDITQWFFFPGFTKESGGLLREQNIQQKRASFSKLDAARWLEQHGLNGPPNSLTICLFGYPDQPLHRFIQATAAIEQSVHLVCHGKLYEELGRPAGQPGRSFAVHPWFDQEQFDRLLWSCDINLVRGEDSWVRAHWANQPFLWQPYRQEQETHIAKLAAFTGQLSTFGEPQAASCATRLMNEISPGQQSDIDEATLQTNMTTALEEYLNVLEPIAQMHHRHNQQLLAQSSLTDRLAAFITDHLQ